MPWRSNALQHVLAFERAVVTPYTFTTMFVPVLLSFYLMAVLVQLPRTTLYRVALLPVVFWSSFRAYMSLDFSWNHPGYAFLNQRLAVSMFTFAMRSTAWAFARRSYSKLSVYCHPGNGTKNESNANNILASSKRHISVPAAMRDALDLIGNPRGIGWNGPDNMPIPMSHLRAESRTTFALHSFRRFILLVLGFDILRTSIRLLGPNTFATPQGGTIFDPLLSPLQRYLKASLITLIAWLGLYVVADAGYQLEAALSAILLRQDPSLWPPIFDSPWLSTSISSFWGRRWHQVYRDFFVEVGGKPIEKYLGPVGMVMGVFTMSGLLHDVGVRAMGRGAHTFQIMGFFFMQGVGVMLERVWRRVTGKRVGGLTGRLWAILWLVGWGNAFTDAWAKSGILGAEFGPEAYSPSLLVLNWVSQSN